MFDNPVYQVLAYYKKTVAKSRVIHSVREDLLHRSIAPMHGNDRRGVFNGQTVVYLCYILLRQNLQNIPFYTFQKENIINLYDSSQARCAYLLAPK